MSQKQAQAYARRFEKVVDYIDRHLDEHLSVERLSQVANFSRFHFHRQFSHYVGHSVSRYVQLMRLKRASHRLVLFPDERVIDIAFDAGFESPETFSRTFRQTFGQTPSAFRKQPDWSMWSLQYNYQKREGTRPMNVRIVEDHEIAVARLEHRGSPASVPETVARFIEWRQHSGLSPVTTSRSFGIAWDDPDLVKPEEFRFDLCGSVTSPVPENPQGVGNGVIPAGRCAVVRHSGSRDRVAESVYYLCRDWLPGSGEEPRDFPVYFEYLDADTEVPDDQRQTDVFMPLK